MLVEKPAPKTKTTPIKMPKPNIVLITLDALRADHLGFAGYKNNTSPFLDSLARNGVVFRRAYSTGASTPQSFAGIMTSTYPLDHGGYSRITEKRTLVSEALQKAGYRTMGFHSNAYLSQYFGYGRGWDIFRYLNHFGKSAVRSGLRSDTWQFKLTKILFDWRNRASERRSAFGSFLGLFEPLIVTARKIYLDMTTRVLPYYTAFEMNEAVKTELRENPEQPLFLWVHYMDAHNPYGLFLRRGKKIISKLQSYLYDYLFTFFSEYPRINRIFNGLYIRMYDEGIRNIDNAIKELFSHLSAIGVLNNETGVFITADHGEEFGEHGGFIHMQKAFNENIRVPLVVAAPRKFSGKPGVRGIPRGLIDLAPTMLEFAGVPRPKNFRGKNMFDDEERDVIAELSDHESDLSGIRSLGQAIVAENHKLIKSKDGTFLFSLDDENEKENISGKNKDIALRLENRLKNFKRL